MPYYRVGGGVLDDLIDGWHSAFGLPDGGRNGRPEGEFLYRFGDRFAPAFLLTEPQTGIGDTQLKFARLIGPDQGFVVQASVEVADRRGGHARGQRFRRLVVTLLRTRPLLARKRPAGYFWGVGLVRAGDPHSIDFDCGNVGADGRRRRQLAAVAEVRSQRAARRARRVLRYAARGARRDRRFRRRSRLGGASASAGTLEFGVVEDSNGEHGSRRRVSRSGRLAVVSVAAARWLAVLGLRRGVRQGSRGHKCRRVVAAGAASRATGRASAVSTPGPCARPPNTSRSRGSRPPISRAARSRVSRAPRATSSRPARSTLIGPNLHGCSAGGPAPWRVSRTRRALQESGLVWTPVSLEAWLTDPTGFVAGTTMAFSGYRSAEDRRDLIAYLLRVTQ